MSSMRAPCAAKENSDSGDASGKKNVKSPLRGDAMISHA